MLLKNNKKEWRWASIQHLSNAILFNYKGSLSCIGDVIKALVNFESDPVSLRILTSHFRSATSHAAVQYKLPSICISSYQILKEGYRLLCWVESLSLTGESKYLPRIIRILLNAHLIKATSSIHTGLCKLFRLVYDRFLQGD